MLDFNKKIELIEKSNATCFLTEDDKFILIKSISKILESINKIITSIEKIEDTTPAKFRVIKEEIEDLEKYVNYVKNKLREEV